MTMIERVKSAIRKEISRQATENGEWHVAYEDRNDVTLDGSFDVDAVARAVIEAMREPTAAMLDAGRMTIGAQYQDMIDAALKEGT